MSQRDGELVLISSKDKEKVKGEKKQRERIMMRWEKWQWRIEGIQNEVYYLCDHLTLRGIQLNTSHMNKQPRLISPGWAMCSETDSLLIYCIHVFLENQILFTSGFQVVLQGNSQAVEGDFSHSQNPEDTEREKKKSTCNTCA